MEKTDKIKMLIISLLKEVSTSIFSKLLPEYLPVKMSVIRTNDLNIANVKFTPIKPNKMKKPSAYVVKSDDEKTFMMESPTVVAPFGLSDFVTGDQHNYSIPLRFDFKPTDEASESDSDEIKSQRIFRNFIAGLDEMAVNYMYDNSMEIIKRKFPNREAGLAVISALYSPLIKNVPGKDGTIYSDRVNIKLGANEDGSGPNPSYLFFKDTAKPLEISTWQELSELIPKGARVKVILQPRIVLMPGKFFLKLHLVQMKVPNIQRTARITGYAFSDPPAEEEETTTAPVVEKDETHAEDSDAEVVEEDA